MTSLQLGSTVQTSYWICAHHLENWLNLMMIFYQIKILKYDFLRYGDKRAWRPRARIRDNNKGVLFKNLRLVKCDPTIHLNEIRKQKINISTVNTRSVCGKSAKIILHIYIYIENIDLCVISETWLQPIGDNVVQGELAQDGYQLNDIPWLERKGSGIALLYCSKLDVTKK